MDLVKEHYGDFGPTLAYEKLAEQHGHRLSTETLRQWMIAENLWQPWRRRQARIHQRRIRRPRQGELVQVDGSLHDWFGGHAGRCTLIVTLKLDDVDRASGMFHLRDGKTGLWNVPLTPAATADATRLRVGLEGERAFAFGNGAVTSHIKSAHLKGFVPDSSNPGRCRS